MFDHLNLRDFTKLTCLYSIKKLVIKDFSNFLIEIITSYKILRFKKHFEGPKQVVEEVEKSHELRKNRLLFLGLHIPL